MSEILIQAAPTEYRRAMTIGDARGNYNGRIDTVNEARDSADEYMRTESREKHNEYVKYLNAAGYMIYGNNPILSSKSENDNQRANEKSDQLAIGKANNNGVQNNKPAVDILIEVEKGLRTSGLPKDFTSSMITGMRGYEINDESRLIRIDEYSKVVIKLIDMFRNVPPLALYSLFYCDGSELKHASVNTLKEMGCYEQIEETRARLLVKEITGKEYNKDISIAIMNLIDCTRFPNYGWLEDASYKDMEDGTEYANKTKQICEKEAYRKGVDALSRIDGISAGKLLQYVGEPDHYFIPWVITEAGRRAAHLLSGCIKGQAFVSMKINESIGGYEEFVSLCYNSLAGIGLLHHQDPEQVSVEVLRTSETHDWNLGILLVHELRSPCRSFDMHRAEKSDDMTDILISAGADVNVRHAEVTPLICAVYLRDAKLVKKLIDAGADPDIKKSKSKSYLYKEAVKYMSKEIKEILSDAKRGR